MSNKLEYKIPSKEVVRNAPEAVIAQRYPGFENRITSLTERFLVTINPSLQFTHYVTGNDKRIKFELYLSNETRQSLHSRGWLIIRQLFEKDLNSIAQDPFGNTSIDPSRSEEFAQVRRSINSLSSELEDIIGLPLAIKGTGKGLPPGHVDREDLQAQYLQMRYLQIASQLKLSDQEREVLEFCPVYGVFKYPIQGVEKYQEWLIMKKYNNAQWVKDAKLTGPTHWKHGMPYAGFDPRQYPELTQFASLGDWHQFFWNLKGRDLIVDSDIRGRNILTFTEKGKQKYAIIDQRG